MQANDINRLLKARSKIDEELRRHKARVTVLFTDVVGSTGYFDRYGDTAGLLLLHRHDHLVAGAVQEFHGIVIKTIGDSVMAEFPEPQMAVLAAIEIQRRLYEQNQNCAKSEQMLVRAGINTGVGFRRGNDLFGDAVNVAARLTKFSGPAQIVVSRSVWEATLDSEIWYKSVASLHLEGKAEPEEIYEVIWTDTAVYEQLRSSLGSVSSNGQVDQFLHTPTPVSGAAAAIAAASVSRYEILDRIGEGGMGVVFKARDRETNETVALKILKPEIADLAPLAEGFKNELRLARKITHKNVCRIYDFTRTEEGAYISMEFVDGESLRQVLNRFGALGFRHGLKIGQQMCDGLREAHAQGIVHGDIKPENFMIDEFGNVKLMDFGLAHFLREESTSAAGTPSYMAPEQTRGEPFDQRADIYALGLVLFEVFTGTAAFTGDIPMLVALKQTEEAPPDPRDIERMLPEHVGTAILRCLEKNPAKRFQSVDALSAALLDEPNNPIKLSHRMRLRLVEAAALVVLFGALVAGGVAFNRNTNSRVELAAFRAAQFADTEEAWTKFLATYREGELVSAAEDRLVQLRSQAIETAKALVEENVNEANEAKADDVKPTEKKPRERIVPAAIDTVTIPGGVFMMGNDGTKKDEGPSHQVTLDTFRMSRTAITNRQYLAFLGDTGHARPKDPSFAKRYLMDYPDLPVVNVSYQDAVDFCRWVSHKFSVAARLPTEAEWEYAARGNRSQLMSKKAVWEWVSDFYSKDYYQISPIRSPAGPPTGTKRVIRGGSSTSDEAQLSSRRASRDPNDRSDVIGFRIVIGTSTRSGQAKTTH